MKTHSKTIIILLILVALWVPLYIVQVTDINREQDGCERLNTVRYQLYSTLEIAADLVRDNDALVAGFKAEQESLELSVTKYDDDTTSNPVDINCDEAYPKPWPL